MIRIPAECRSTVSVYAINTWWKSCNVKELFFKHCTAFRDLLGEFMDDREDVPNATVAVMLAKSVDAEQSLLDHILGNKQEVKDDKEWYHICTSAGWIIMQDYDRVSKKGEK